MPFIETRDGTPIFYKDWGQGRPIVLSHGWPLNADMWEYQMPYLAELGYRVVAHDRRGFGRSGQPWQGYDYDRFADDLADLITGLDLRYVTLVGFSMGGGEVARYLTRHGPGRIAKAVLVSAVTPFLLKTDTNPDGVDAGVFDDMIEKLKDDRPAFLDSFGKKFFGGGLLGSKASSEVRLWASILALQASPKATIDCVRAFSETDFRADMAAFVDVPTLIIHGDDDQVVPIEASGRITRRMIPHAEMIEYPGAPHALFFTEKERLNKDLAAFAMR